MVVVPFIVSVWKFSPGTAKRPRLDQTKTEVDQKISGPLRTATMVQSLVHINLEIVWTDERPLRTGLDWSFSH